MVDRLKDLKTINTNNLSRSDSDDTDRLTDFLEECTVVSDDINKIEENINLITIDTNDKKFNEITKNITNSIKDTKNRIDVLSKYDFTGSEKMIQTNSIRALYTKLHNTYNLFVNKTETIEKKNEKFHQSIVKSNKEGSNKEELENEKTNGNILMYETEYETEYKTAESTLGYIQNRHNDIVKLAQSIEELKQLFVDMAFLVSQQGELLDVVETNVNKAEKDIEKGVEEIVIAVKYQNKSRKKLYILLAIIIIILISVISPVLAIYL